eukprot:scaffold7420_cov28-Tisochrysis_lutea.AAC.3
MHLKKVSSKLQRRLIRRLEAERCVKAPTQCMRAVVTVGSLAYLTSNPPISWRACVGKHATAASAVSVTSARAAARAHARARVIGVATAATGVMTVTGAMTVIGATTATGPTTATDARVLRNDAPRSRSGTVSARAEGIQEAEAVKALRSAVPKSPRGTQRVKMLPVPRPHPQPTGLDHVDCASCMQMSQRAHFVAHLGVSRSSISLSNIGARCFGFIRCNHRPSDRVSSMGSKQRLRPVALRNRHEFALGVQPPSILRFAMVQHRVRGSSNAMLLPASVLASSALPLSVCSSA